MTTVSAAQSFYPRAFIDTMREGFIHLDATLREFSDYAERARVEVEISEDRVDPHNQRSISILYDNIMSTGRETLLFMALCRKNIAFMPVVASKVHDDVMKATGRRIWARAYAHDDTIKREMEQFSTTFFNCIESLATIIGADTWEYRAATPFRGDPYLIEMRPGGPLTRLDFNDWMEFNFFRFHRIPLGLYERAHKTEKTIARQTDTPVYRKQIAERVWKKRLHVYFPGLSLDPDGDDPSELERLSKHLGPHVLFTPDTTARIVRAPADDLPFLFGKLTFHP